ncbi:hypothetical protein SCG7086_CS_00040 [Chlamydiales bacterium SCGC AG-110-P3]|nr:hypothetical protein SCG7086_CS_00040 [Chlamydiales bacterium SCGC AG-110-P3]
MHHYGNRNVSSQHGCDKEVDLDGEKIYFTSLKIAI